MPEVHPPRSTHAAAPSILLDELTTRARYDIEQMAASVSPGLGLTGFTLSSPDEEPVYGALAEPSDNVRCVPFETYINGVMKPEGSTIGKGQPTAQAAVAALVEGLRPIVEGKRLFWHAYPRITTYVKVNEWFAQCRLAA